jgi:hypothetical protein
MNVGHAIIRETRWRDVKEFGEFSNVALAQLSLAIENHGCDGAGAEDGCQVRGLQVVLVHQKPEDADRIGGGQWVDAIVILFNQQGQERMERLFFRPCFTVCDRAAELFHYVDKMIELRTGFNAFRQCFRQ